MNQISKRLQESGGRTALVRGVTAPPKPTNTVTVEPDVAASLGVNRAQSPLYVTAEAPSGRTVRRYDGTDARAAADCAAELTDERDPTAVWLCARDRIAARWTEGVAELLESRLADAARAADARLVVWSARRDVAVGDRYDVVLDA